MVGLLQQFYGKMRVGFSFNIETYFITEIPKNDQWKERNLQNCIRLFLYWNFFICGILEL